nr:hypothetical protein BaRGS_011214 [Batillaria attramentaria]
MQVLALNARCLELKVQINKFMFSFKAFADERRNCFRLQLVQQDDERFCSLSCPQQCRCQGLAFVCNRRFQVDLFPDIRFLDGSGSGVTPAELTSNFNLIGLSLSGCIPLLPLTSYWEFYSQTGICIPLPITQHEFPGQGYSFGIMIVLNFVLFVLIAVGQFFIYWCVRANSLTVSDSSKKSRDCTIARRLAAIALSDFLCWFPIGLLGLMATRGVPIASEVNVGIAIFVLPLNSALNPFLYTLNALMEKRRARQKEKLMKVLEARIKSGILQTPATQAQWLV